MQVTRNSEIWLSLDLSGDDGSLALHRWNRVPDIEPNLLDEQTLSDRQKHCERLIDSLNFALLKTRLELSDVDRFITTLGPGSFTGLRIAFATLKAFAYALNKPLETLDASEVRALSVRKDAALPEFGEIIVHTLLTPKQYEVATFRPDGKGVKLTDRYCVEGPLEERPVIPRLSAALLGKFLLVARSRKTHQSFNELTDLSPSYVGSARFG